MRGENTCQIVSDCLQPGSSPHARGKRMGHQLWTSRRRLIPACAGKTMSLSRITVVGKAHPRMRGENRRIVPAPLSCVGSSPHARGKPSSLGVGVVMRGLIPACAGKTCISQPFRFAVWAHPRMRGENAPPRPRNTRGVGSSPHARGKLRPGKTLIRY